MSFLSCEAHARLQNNQLLKLNSLINWKEFAKKMGNLGRSGYGPEGYEPVKMLKALILQAWHCLSDNELEEALRVRLDFMVFTDLNKVPDSTTLCRFRNLLIDRGLMDEILETLNQQLECQGLKVKTTSGAIVDATVIASAARPRKEITAIAEDREEDSYVLGEETLSCDPDARWLKKGHKSYFGYKCFAVVDAEDGYVKNAHVTSANVSEVREFENIAPKIENAKRVYGDKGYASQNNIKLIKGLGLKNGLMEKAHKNKPLRRSQILFNRLISRTRYKVEQLFGTWKRKFKFVRASYYTVAKVHGQMILKAMAFNLLKGLNKFIFAQDNYV